MESGNKPLDIVVFGQSMDNEGEDFMVSLGGEITHQDRGLILEEIAQVKTRGSQFLDKNSLKGWILTERMGVIEFRTSDRDVSTRIAPVLVLITIDSDVEFRELSSMVAKVVESFTITHKRARPENLDLGVKSFLEERDKKKRRALAAKLGLLGVVVAIGVSWWWWRRNSF